MTRRAASPATRRQYASIHRAFGDWLMGELGRPPLVGDMDADAIAAYSRHLEARGGRGGRPAAPATRRVYVTAVRALACSLGRPDADEVRVPGHKPGRPETLTDTDYANLLRVPDARTTIGRRDIALLRVLGDCGLRSAEMRGLTAGDIRRPRSNARHYELHVLGKGNRERNVELPTETKAALDAWLTVHPLAGGRGRPLRDEHPLFVRLGRHPGQEQPKPLSAQLVHKLVNRTGTAPAFPSGSATSLLESGVPVHVVQDGLGHADLRTTGRYAVVRQEHTEERVDVLDRRHQAAARERSTTRRAR
jgi:integrase